MHASSDSAERRDMSEIGAKILENIASKMLPSLANLEKEEQNWNYWDQLQEQSQKEIKELEKSLQ
jgi:hypothetical protein